MLDHESAVSLEERLGRKFSGDRAVDADDLGFKPQARNHSRGPDVIEHFGYSVREPGQ